MKMKMVSKSNTGQDINKEERGKNQIITTKDEEVQMKGMHRSSWNTFLWTGVACGVSAMLTYPAHAMKQNWQSTALSQWSYNTSRASWLKVQTTIQPWMRLTLHEMALAGVEQGVPRPSDELLAGALAGLSQAILICPLEAYVARQQMLTEKHQHQHQQNQQPFQRWWTWAQVPAQDRLNRAYKGVGGMAIREIVLNCSFFPLFHYLQCKQDWHVIPSGIVAGSICAQFVSPIDIWTTYMTHSRQTWHWWNGRQLQAPSLHLLFRGISLQALVFGPSFGIVAAISQLISPQSICSTMTNHHQLQ